MKKLLPLQNRMVHMCPEKKKEKRKSKCCVLALTLNSSRFGAQRIKLRELVGILLGWSA